MKKIMINKENLPLIKSIIKKTLLRKGKFVKISEIKRNKSFWKQKNNIKKLMNNYDNCYHIFIHNDETVMIETETCIESLDSFDFPETDFSIEEINEGYFYYNGNGKEFWIEKCEQPQDKFERMFISTIDHYVRINNIAEYNNIEKSVVFTGESLKDYGNMLLSAIKICDERLQHA